MHTPSPPLTPKFPNRRRALSFGLVALAAGLGGHLAAQATTRKPLVQVWKNPNCGCCKDWMVHLQQAGFEVEGIDKGNTAKRAAMGMPQSLGSCHTAVVQGYVIEGHVPASDIWRLLAQKPAALGLAVPAMPIGSPGMDGPEHGGKRDPYRVLLVKKDGSTQVFNAYT